MKQGIVTPFAGILPTQALLAPGTALLRWSPDAGRLPDPTQNAPTAGASDFFSDARFDFQSVASSRGVPPSDVRASSANFVPAALSESALASACDLILRAGLTPKTQDESFWHQREPVASEVNSRIDSFIMNSGDRLRGDDVVLFFWDLGKFLSEAKREFQGAEDCDVDAWLSSRINADNALLKDRLLEYGIDVETMFSPSSLGEMQRLSRIFPRDYLARVAKTLSVMPGGVWTYVREIIALPDPFERVYYAEMASRFRWTLATFRHNLKMQRFHTHTVVRQSDEILRKAFVQLSKGDMSEWVYRDLLRFDFLKGGAEFKDLTEPKFEEFMLGKVGEIVAEFGDGFTFVENQAVRYYEDKDGNRKLIRLDILLQVSDGQESYPLVVELKKGAFTEIVNDQCVLYKHVLRGKDADGNRIEPGGYLKPNESKVLVMALVTKFDREYEKIMELGLRKDGRRSSVFVSLYTYDKPPQEFLDKTIGAQLKASAERALRDKARLAKQGADFEAGTGWGEADELFSALMTPEEAAAKDSHVPF